MAPKKGVEPPALRKWRLAQRSKRGSSGPPGPTREKPKGQTMGKAKAAVSGMLGKASEALGAPVRPLQMLLSGGFGYIAPKLLDRIGASEMIAKVDSSGRYTAYLNDYWSKNIGGIQQKASGLADAGNQVLANWLGVLSAGKVMYDGASKGKFDAKDVNFFGPFAIGQYLDAPEGPIGVAGGSGALGGISGPSGPGNSTSPLGGCGWL